MSALSVFLGACAFFSASFIGLWLKKRLIKKAEFYKDYSEYLAFALEKIGYERTIVSEINTSFRGKSKEFSDLLNGNDPNVPIEEKRLSEIKEYISKIGTTDADTQIASLSSECAAMKRYVEKECAAFKKDAALRFKLAVLVGAALFVILV